MRREGNGLGREERNVGGIRISPANSRNVNIGWGGNRISSCVYAAWQSKSKLPSFRNANPGSDGEFGDRRKFRERGRSEIDIRPRVDRHLGNDDEYMDPNDVEIERIDEAEFRNKRTHSIPGPSTRQEADEYMDPNDVEIERIDEAEFRNKRTHSMPSTRQESVKGYSAATPRKHLADPAWSSNFRGDCDRGRLGKRRTESDFSAGLSGSILPENAWSSSNHWLQDRLSSTVKIGNGHEDKVLRGVGFRTEKPHDISKIGPSNRQEMNEGHVVTPWKNVRRSMPLCAYCRSLSPSYSDR